MLVGASFRQKSLKIGSILSNVEKKLKKAHIKKTDPGLYTFPFISYQTIIELKILIN